MSDSRPSRRALSRTQSALSCSVCVSDSRPSQLSCLSSSVDKEPSLEHRVLCLALCVSDSAQPAELPQ